MGLFEFLLCAALVGTSAFMSSAEIALFSLSRFQLRALKDSARGPHRKIKRLLGDPGGLLITILVVNEVVNIALSAIITDVISRNEGARNLVLKVLPFDVPHWALDTAIGVLIISPIVLFLCEITPKTIGAKANELVAPLTATPLMAVYDFFRPARIALRVMVGLASGTSRRPKTDEDGRPNILKEAEFLLMLEEGHREGAVRHSEVELIKNVFELDDTNISAVATPISQVQTISEHTTVKTAMQTMLGQRYSRVPVLSANRKQVVGVLYTKDLIRAKLEPAMLTLTVRALMKKPLLVPATLRLNSLFRKFKQQKTHIAILQSPGGEAVGIVTMSDVLDTLFEDVLPEEELEE